MTVWNRIFGHDWAVSLLKGAINNNRTGHAYLFTGPEQVGKTTLARTFAQALNCQAADPAVRPCGSCRACTLIAAGRHPDVRTVEPEITGRGQLSLKIEQIRELQHGLNLAAYEARYKVAILRRFDAASTGAANAFLKTLEEPPRDVVLLLTAGDADELLPTITSRCHVLALRPVPAAEIRRALVEQHGVAAERAELLSGVAEGRMGWAISAAGDPALLETRQEQLDQLQAALSGRRVSRFEWADKLAKKPEELPALLKTWLSWWHDLLHLSWGRENGRISNVDRKAELEELARTWEREAILRAVQQTGRALWQLEHNANTRLVLENLLLSYPLP